MRLDQVALCVGSSSSRGKEILVESLLPSWRLIALGMVIAEGSLPYDTLKKRLLEADAPSG